MSGFEIAGVVLGAFPLAIEGLKAYESLARGWKIWRDIKREYKQCLSELKYHHLTFADHLRCLLLPLVVEPPRIESLIAEPRGKEWDDIELDRALRQRLHRSYDLYLDIICSLQSLMEKAKEHLGIESPELQARLISTNGDDMQQTIKMLQPSDQSLFTKENISYQQYRIKFSMGETTRRRFFADLQRYIERLQGLLNSSDKIRGLERNMPWYPNQNAGPPSDVEICKFWQHAQKVYNAFSEAWICNCRSQHQTQLMLQHRTNNDKEMRLILRESIPDDSGLFTEHGVTIRESTDSEDFQECPKHKIAPLSPPKAPNHKLITPLKSALSKLKSQKNIKASQTKQNGPVVQMHGLSQGDMHGASRDHQLITNLCYKLQEGLKSSTSSEYLQGEKSKYYIWARPEAANKLHLGRPSLEDMLCGAGSELDRQQRYMISHILASSFVQLQNTSWIVSSWQKSNVIFPERTVDTNVTDHRKPFVTHQFPEHATKHEANLPAQNLVSLGVTLLELCFGNVIEAHPKRAKLPVGVETAEIKAAFDFAAASEWLRKVEGEAGPDFTNAIEWCLFKHKTFHDTANWRHEMFQQVVRPLKRAMNSWTPQPIAI